MLRFFQFFPLALALLFPISFAAADELDLTIERSDETIVLTFDDLSAMDAIKYETSTIWTEGDQTFTGVSLKALLASIGVEDGTISLTALDDYAFDIDVATLEDDAPIVAYLNNGEPMSVRGWGPFWVVFPYDSDGRYQTEIVYSQSVWQMNRIVILD